MEMIVAREKRMPQLNELDKFWMEAYENTKLIWRGQGNCMINTSRDASSL